MSVLSHLFVCQENDAPQLRRLDENGNLVRNFASSNVQGIDPSNLAILVAILRSTSYDPAIEDEFDVVLEESGTDAGPWVFGFPKDFASMLSQVSEQTIPQIAHQWKQSDEIMSTDWTEDGVALRLRQLWEASKQAVEDRQILLLWMSV